MKKQLKVEDRVKLSKHASRFNNLDDAIAAVMEALDIPDGDNAGIYFSGYSDNDWEDDTAEERQYKLMCYMDYEETWRVCAKKEAKA